MSKGSILVVEDDFDISNMLKIYFSGQGYSVEVAGKGGDAITSTRKQLPNLIVLDINLPDMSGYDVCRELRTTTRTKHIPIIFLTQKDDRSDKIIGLELGADDYVTKPFDIEELKLRIGNAITSSKASQLINPTSGFPTGAPIEEHLRELMRKDSDWSYVDLKITNFDPFKEVYGWQAGDEVIRATALMITDILDQHGTTDDFAGHPGSDNFVIITHASAVEPLQDALQERFESEIQQHYSFIDRERGYMLLGDDQKDLMTLSLGSVSTQTHQFSDIREITELAADDRRRKLSGDTSVDDGSSDILTAW
ncbi:MAG: response regulator [Phototrophicaceae bacterium]